MMNLGAARKRARGKFSMIEILFPTSFSRVGKIPGGTIHQLDREALLAGAIGVLRVVSFAGPGLLRGGAGAPAPAWIRPGPGRGLSGAVAGPDPRNAIELLVVPVETGDMLERPVSVCEDRARRDGFLL